MKITVGSARLASSTPRSQSRRASQKAPGQKRIYTAGEKEYLTWLERREKGVPVNRETQKEMVAMRDELGLKKYKFAFE